MANEPNLANEPIPAPRNPAGEEPQPASSADFPVGVQAPVGEGVSGEVAPVGVNAPAPDKFQPAQPEPSDPAGKRFTVFADERDVFREGMYMRDDISATQMSGQSTRDVSTNHLARLFYDPIEQPGGPVYQSQQLERRLRRE